MTYTNYNKKFEEGEDLFYQKVLEGFGECSEEETIRDYFAFLERKTDMKKHTDIKKVH